MDLGDTGHSIAFVMETSPLVMGNFLHISQAQEIVFCEEESVQVYKTWVFENIGLGSPPLLFYILLFDITFSSKYTYTMASFSITLYNTKKK